ncbi:hypothetical protein N9E25_01685 [Verrucomicrobiales bacterium]|nr:hypothetical protein [Verrucomicrobiales bacterium]MDB2642223.1 hypothetical protein [bacterium]
MGIYPISFEIHVLYAEIALTGGGVIDADEPNEPANQNPRVPRTGSVAGFPLVTSLGSDEQRTTASPKLDVGESCGQQGALLPKREGNVLIMVYSCDLLQTLRDARIH